MSTSSGVVISERDGILIGRRGRSMSHVGKSGRIRGRGHGKRAFTANTDDVATSADEHGKTSNDEENNGSGSLRLIIRLGNNVPRTVADDKISHSVASLLNVQTYSRQSSANATSSESLSRDQVMDDSINNNSPKNNDLNFEDETIRFCIASEAETYVDPNQVQIDRLLNRALPLSTGLIGLYPHSPGDNEDGEGCDLMDRRVEGGSNLSLTNQALHRVTLDRVPNYSAVMAPQVGCTADRSRSQCRTVSHCKRQSKQSKRFKSRVKKSVDSTEAENSQTTVGVLSTIPVCQDRSSYAMHPNESNFSQERVHDFQNPYCSYVGSEVISDDKRLISRNRFTCGNLVTGSLMDSEASRDLPMFATQYNTCDSSLSAKHSMDSASHSYLNEDQSYSSNPRILGLRELDSFGSNQR